MVTVLSRFSSEYLVSRYSFLIRLSSLSQRGVSRRSSSSCCRHCFLPLPLLLRRCVIALSLQNLLQRQSYPGPCPTPLSFHIPPSSDYPPHMRETECQAARPSERVRKHPEVQHRICVCTCVCATQQQQQRRSRHNGSFAQVPRGAWSFI